VVLPPAVAVVIRLYFGNMVLARGPRMVDREGVHSLQSSPAVGRSVETKESRSVNKKCIPNFSSEISWEETTWMF
jgi:hypothetical protein